ncbi:transposase [Streptosporangium sp. CA-115845]|uniref:transposase n=1 Tax=Streptosporangium sp. CA-115845 TaxID=3240071 RepID=UPI003D8E71D8
MHGYDSGKKANGRKRHLLADTLGIVCKVYVSAANIGDRDGAAVLLRRSTHPVSSKAVSYTSSRSG